MQRRRSLPRTIWNRSRPSVFAARRWPRIAAVSRLSLTSRSRDKPHAWRIEVDGGEVGITQPAALASGTTVTVQELYFNTPARKKFLRTDATEYGHSEEAFRRIALSHPNVGFTLQHNGSVRHRLLAQGQRARVDALLGDVFAAQAATVDESSLGPIARGLGGPARVRDVCARCAVSFRQRSLRPRSRAHARLARGFSRRASSRPATRVCLVVDDRPAQCRRQRPSDQE